eukprot:15475399-Alexandrium_andersonii.AAC.1
MIVSRLGMAADFQPGLPRWGPPDCVQPWTVIQGMHKLHSAAFCVPGWHPAARRSLGRKPR